MKFYDYPTWAWKQKTADSPSKMVLVALASFADNAGGCYPSHKRLASMSGLSLKTIKRKIALLEEQGLITTDERWRGDGTRASNQYWLNAPNELANEPGEQIEFYEDEQGRRVSAREQATNVGRQRAAKWQEKVDRESGVVDRESAKMDPVTPHELLKNNPPNDSAALRANAVAPSGDEPENPANDENGDDDMADDELFDVADVDPAAAQRIEARELDKQKNKRAQALTKVYTSRVKLSVFPAVMKVVRRTVDAGFTDQQIEYALKDLAASQRSVTVDSMRIALDAAPEPEPAPKPCPCCTQASEGSTSDLCEPCKDAFWRRNSRNCTHDAAMLDE